MVVVPLKRPRRKFPLKSPDDMDLEEVSAMATVAIELECGCGLHPWSTSQETAWAQETSGRPQTDADVSKLASTTLVDILFASRQAESSSKRPVLQRSGKVCRLKRRNLIKRDLSAFFFLHSLSR